LFQNFSPDDYVINLLRRGIANAQDVCIYVPSVGGVTILSESGEYFTDIVNLNKFCQCHAKDFKIKVFDDSKVKSYKYSVGRNVDELMWQAGFYASAGRLMEGCNWDDVLELDHWPNFTRLPITANTLRIASLLSHQATSIEYIITCLRISREEAYQFYSAARCAGLVRVVNRSAKEPSLKPHRNQALLSLLLKKIGQNLKLS